MAASLLNACVKAVIGVHSMYIGYYSESIEQVMSDRELEPCFIITRKGKLQLKRTDRDE